MVEGGFVKVFSLSQYGLVIDPHYSNTNLDVTVKVAVSHD